ncbi:hypothetical protein BEWA_020340 [Theileria equi strain WA]|uniref:very-long-chain (3R)-3-hydroxyacyl-CoA dehydratase n=1 Tax=Theileria equi strain WA TaxID=1537102 RepID=L0AVB2_THEEQ|nr:hypothetical protein BEWA_020340 [Theileria equi strain WA]AFZ79188.1 hypothetical protein BEWA_020340 [Theileria equi strain WA]|eukprot:XP_004828854.1 hypothetical protein BEWA_020340 [Theileria equi strain WA]
MGLKLPPDRLYNRAIIAFNCVVLALWLYIEGLIVYYIYKNVYTGATFNLNAVSIYGLWSSVENAFKLATVVHSLNIFYVYFGTEYDKKCLYMTLFHHVKGYIMYFISFNLLKETLEPRWALVNICIWTSLNILHCINAINFKRQQRSEFLEWIYQKMFITMFPLLTLSELLIINRSAPFLKEMEKFREFPSRMPNPYNFQIDLYIVYQCLPPALIVSSIVVYLNRIKFT